jgi:hypothetical protein
MWLYAVNVKLNKLLKRNEKTKGTSKEHKLILKFVNNNITSSRKQLEQRSVNL